MSWILIPLAGILSMDRNTAFNFMISRPFVVSALIGTLFGNVGWCLLGGVVFEIIGLMDLPVGTRINWDDTFAAFAYSVVVSTLPTVNIAHCLLLLASAYLCMYPATATIFFTRWINKKLYERYPCEREGLLIALGQIISFLRGVIVYMVGVVVISALHDTISAQLTFPTIPPLAVIILLCLMSGYFSGLFHNKLALKMLLLLSGGVLSWLFL